MRRINERTITIGFDNIYMHISGHCDVWQQYLNKTIISYLQFLKFAIYLIMYTAKNTKYGFAFILFLLF